MGRGYTVASRPRRGNDELNARAATCLARNLVKGTEMDLFVGKGSAELESGQSGCTYR